MTILGDARLDQPPPALLLEANSRVLLAGQVQCPSDTPYWDFTVPAGYGNWRCLFGSWACGYFGTANAFTAVQVQLDGVLQKYHRNTQNQAGWKPYHPVFFTADLTPGVHRLGLAPYAPAPVSMANGTWSYFVLGGPIEPAVREKKGSLAAGGLLGAKPLTDPFLLGDFAWPRGFQIDSPSAAGPHQDVRKGVVITGAAGRKSLVIVSTSAFNTAVNVFAVLGCYLRRTDNNAVAVDMGLSFLGFNEGSTHHAFPPFIWYGELPATSMQAAVRVGASTSSDANDLTNTLAIHGV